MEILKPKMYKIEKIWYNDTVYLLGGGPSLNQVDFSLIKDKNVIGINNSYQLGDWVKICWFGDARWYEWHKENIAKLQDRFWITCSPDLVGKVPDYIKTVKIKNKEWGINKDPNFIAWNRSSGASAINLAYHLGANKIILLGFDMKLVEDKYNWHEAHPITNQAKWEARYSPYPRFLEPFENIKQDAKKLEIEIINCTPDSALTLFPMKKLEEVINAD